MPQLGAHALPSQSGRTGRSPRALVADGQQTLTVAVERALSVDAKGVGLAGVDPHVGALVHIDAPVVAVPYIARSAHQTPLRTPGTTPVGARLVARLAHYQPFGGRPVQPMVFRAGITVGAVVGRLTYALPGALAATVSLAIAPCVAYAVGIAWAGVALRAVVSGRTARLHLAHA
jgi:hypothetical protein